MASSFTSSSSYASSSSWKYDVFLSFRGKDTRNTFTDHLYDALSQKGIKTFRDDPDLKRGEFMAPTLLTAIEESRHAIIILSENYASSKWCLEELVKILQTQNTPKRRVVPIFYYVKPSDVGNLQSANFGKAMADHEEKLKADHENKSKYDMERVEEWKKALTRVGKISGSVFFGDK